MKLFIANLSYSTTSKDLEELFNECGSVVSAQVVMDRETGRSRGFGFVEMSSSSESETAIERLNGKSVDGRPIVVKEAENKQPARNGGGGGGYRGGHRDRHGSGSSY